MTFERERFEIGNRCSNCCAQTYWATKYPRLCSRCEAGVDLAYILPIPWPEWLSK